MGQLLWHSHIDSFPRRPRSPPRIFWVPNASERNARFDRDLLGQVLHVMIGQLGGDGAVRFRNAAGQQVIDRARRIVQ